MFRIVGSKNRVLFSLFVCLLTVMTARAATFTVNVTTDGSDASPGDGLCRTGVGANCTLRAAIEEANAFAGTDTITFSIGAGAGVITISPGSAYPIITQPVTIDGWTQGGVGYTGPPLIEIDGTSATGSGLTVQGGNSLIRGLIINSFSGTGIYLKTGGGNSVEGCYLGTNKTGTTALGNYKGVLIEESSNNRVGGSVSSVRNIISGNTDAGVAVVGATATLNIVTGNYIGTTVNGTVSLGNAEAGVELSHGAFENTVGGELMGERNVISGNKVGISMYTPSGPGGNPNANTIVNNYIGTNALGTVALGNTTVGVEIIDSPNNRIGGVTSSRRNIISGNLGNFGAVYITGALSTGNTVKGNYIGTDASGTVGLGNGQNGFDGVRVNGASNNQIGGANVAEGNVIAFNSYAGVSIIGTATGNSIRKNSIFQNGIDAGAPFPGGIDLGNNGVTLNDTDDPDTGANALQNFPVITSATSVSGNVADIDSKNIFGVGSTDVAGSLNSTPNVTFFLDFYSSPAVDYSNYGEGQTYLGTTIVTTDAGGDITFAASFAIATPAGNFISATATDPAGNTSEFSLAKMVSGPTAASVTISGRVLTREGRGVRSAYVVLTDSQGVTHQTLTGRLGYYAFEGVEAGQTYIIGVRSRRFEFAPRVISVTDELTDIDFVAGMPKALSKISVVSGVRKPSHIKNQEKSK